MERVWSVFRGHFRAAGIVAPATSARPLPSKMIADRAALYLELRRRRRRAAIMARRALAIATPVAAASATPVATPIARSITAAARLLRQDCSNGSFHCAVNSSRAAEAAIGSTDMSAA